MTGKEPAYGGIVVDAKGRILLREPSGHFDGYVWTFPKGRPQPGETAEEAALRETREETGWSGDPGANPRHVLRRHHRECLFPDAPDRRSRPDGRRDRQPEVGYARRGAGVDPRDDERRGPRTRPTSVQPPSNFRMKRPSYLTPGNATCVPDSHARLRWRPLPALFLCSERRRNLARIVCPRVQRFDGWRSG